MNHPLLAEEGKAIRDPVWGYIHVPDPVLALVDTEDFQRLRNITQLGYVQLVYPGARHSRFEHSLGVSQNLPFHQRAREREGVKN